MRGGQMFNKFYTSSDNGIFPSISSSTSLVSKLAFLFLVLVAFIILLRIGITTLSYLVKPSSSPHLIDGMVNASQMVIFPQDPINNNAVTIYRSVNESDGVEFTWSVWIYINSLQTNQGIYKHIFSKGNSTLNKNGMVEPNNAPGLYIAPDTNALVVIMNTFNVINEEVTIPDIPLNKWVNILIRCKNTVMDVYINGTITRSVDLMGVPKQNYGDVYVGMNGGFDGYLSNLWYYDYALGTAAIQQLINKGPNTKMIGGNGILDNMHNYLSLRWYFVGDNAAADKGLF